MKFHKKKWILTQCAKRNVPYVEPIPDRYFFHMNYYKGYQGIGKGIPFTEKVSKIVYIVESQRIAEFAVSLVDFTPLPNGQENTKLFPLVLSI